MSERSEFATVITCMDGRVQEPVAQWMKQHFDVRYVDTITAAGPDRRLAEGPAERVAQLRHRAGISVDAHHSHVIAVVAHHDCAGNPVGKDEHLAHLRRALDEVRSWAFPVRLIGLWVDEAWEVACVFDSEVALAAA
jgi:hypothetical protein